MADMANIGSARDAESRRRAGAATDTDVSRAPSVGLVGAVALMFGATLAGVGVALSRTDLAISAAVAIVALLPAAAVDVREQRLPNRLVLAAAVAAVVAGLIELGVGERLADVSVARLALGVALFAGPLLMVHLASPSSMGFGDVKAAVVLGLALGTVDPLAPLVALLLACALGAIAGAVAGRRTVPFGPALVVGAAIAVAITDQVVAR